MTTEQVWLGAAGVVALLALALVLGVALSASRRARRAERLLTALAQRVTVLESPVAEAPRPVVAEADVSTFVITHLGEDDEQDRPSVAPAPVAVPIDGRLFADIVARETVVKAASWSHGLRRALSPETRNRIRFQVRQETKRAGRERRAEMKQALREYRARDRADRADLGPDLGEDVA